MIKKEGNKFCSEVFPDTALTCSLVEGHEGNHVAYGTNAEILKKWGDSEVSTELKTLKDLKIEERLAYVLDEELYLPVKQELAGCGRSYSLGIRKENFKGEIEKQFKILRQTVIEWIKEDLETSNSSQFIGNFDSVAGLHVSEAQKWMKRFNITEEDLKDE